MSLAQAHYYAQRSTFKRHKTGAVITDVHGTQLAQGWSHYSETSLSELYSFHAEIHALWNLRGTPLHPARHIYIVTLTRVSNVTCAKPCITCAVALLRAGIKYATYTLQDGTTETIELADHLDSLKLYAAPVKRPTGLLSRFAYSAA